MEKDPGHAGITSDPLGSSLGRAAFEASTECMIVLQPDGIVVAVNRAFCELYGIEASKTVGQHYWSFSADYDIRRFGDRLSHENWVTARALGGETVRGVLQGVRNRATGREFFGRYGATPVFERGEMIATIITVLDVTEASRAAQGLAAALSAAEIGTWRADVKERRFWGDENFARICGLQETEVEGAPLARLYDLIHPDDRERVLAIFKKATDEGRAHEVEYRIVWPSGETRWIVSRGMVALSESGDLSERVGSIVDVTRQRQSEAMLRDTTDAVPVLVSYTDASLVYRFCNEAYEKFFGRPREEIVGKFVGDVVGASSFAATKPYFDRALAGEEVSFSAWLDYEDIGSRFMRIEYRPRVGPDGQVEGLYALVVDETARRRAEEDLERSESLARSVIDTVVEGVCVIGADGGMLLTNAAFDKLHYEGDAAYRTVEGFQRTFELFEADGTPIPLERWPVNRALRGERVAGWDIFVKRTDTGKEFWGSYSAAPVYGADGTIETAVLSVSDVTNRIRSEQELRDAKARIEGVLATADVGTWVLDVKHDRVFADRNLAAMFGVDSEVADGGPTAAYLEQIHLDDRENVASALYRSMTEGVPFDMEYRIFSGGLERWVTARGLPERDENGEVARLAGVAVDVTDLKRAERREREAAERLRLLIESVPEIAWTADSEGTLDYYNERWYEYTGAEPGLIGDLGWAPWVHPDDQDNTLETWRHSIATGEPFEEEVRLRDYRTREYRWFLSRARPLRDSEGNIVRWFGIASDIHEQKTRERSLAFLSELAEATKTLSDAEEIISTCQRMLGEYVGASRCAYAEMEEDEDGFTIVRDWSPGLPSTVGTYSLRLFGEMAFSGLRRGETIWVNDVDKELAADDGRDTFNAIGIKAVICTSLMKRGRLVALMALHQDQPRKWTRTEIQLLETVADRCWDAIERVRVERALRQSAVEYRQIAEGLPQMVWGAGPDGVRDYFNERWFEYTGVGLAESENPWLAALHPEDRDRALGAWWYSIESGQLFQSEYRLRSRDGFYRWFLGRAIPLRNTDGQVIRWFGTCTDIHEQKATQRILQIANEFAQTLAADLDLERIVQALTDASTQAVGAQFGSFFYNVVNEQGEAYLLYTLSGAPMEAFSKFGMPRATKVFGPTFNAEGVVRSDDITQDPRYGQMAPHFGMPKGHLPVVSYLAVPVVSRSGEVIGGLFFGHPKPRMFTEEHERIVSSFAAQAAVAMDNARLYTRVRGINEELEVMVRERTMDLQASNDALQGFTYHVSHDLRAPLRGIASTSRIVQEDFGGSLPEEAIALLDRQAEAATKLGRLIDDLLRLSRLSQKELDKRPVDLTAMAREAAVEALESHPDSQVKIEVQEGLETRADASLLRLAIGNLIENGVKYSPAGGTVRVGRRDDGTFFVSDEGIGIEQRYFARIFEPFQRLHRDDEFAGTGIGLSNVKQVIERHGGHVWVESQPGKGSTFLFTLGPRNLDAAAI